MVTKFNGPQWLILALTIVLGGCSGDLGPLKQAVEASALDIDSLTIESLRDHSQRGESLQYAATALLADSSSQDFSTQVRWKTSDSSIAAINQNGLLTALGTGQTTISAEFSNLSATSGLTINDAVLSSIRIGNTEAIDVCKDRQLSAIGVYDDGTEREILDLVNWSASPASIGSILDSGKGKGQFSSTSAGDLTLTASKDSVTGQQPATVQATLDSIEVSPVSVQLAIDKTQQYEALGNYQNSSVAINLSSNVAWSSSSIAIATVNSTGLAVTLATGNTTISANCGGETGQQTLTVSDSSTGRLQFLFDDKIISSLNRDDDSDFSLTLESVSNDNLTTKDVTEDADWSIQQQDSGLTVSISNAENSKGALEITGSGSFVVKAAFDDLETLLQIDIK